MPREDGFKNLIPAKKGEVRNPHGRHKGKIIRTQLEEVGKVILTDELLDKLKVNKIADNLSIDEHLKYTLVYMGMQGSLEAIKEYLNRVEGKPVNKIETIEVKPKYNTDLLTDEEKSTMLSLMSKVKIEV